MFPLFQQAPNWEFRWKQIPPNKHSNKAVADGAVVDSLRIWIKRQPERPGEGDPEAGIQPGPTAAIRCSSIVRNPKAPTASNNIRN